jgi:hypothetical protein
MIWTRLYPILLPMVLIHHICCSQPMQLVSPQPLQHPLGPSSFNQADGDSMFLQNCNVNLHPNMLSKPEKLQSGCMKSLYIYFTFHSVIVIFSEHKKMCMACSSQVNSYSCYDCFKMSLFPKIQVFVLVMLCQLVNALKDHNAYIFRIKQSKKRFSATMF